MTSNIFSLITTPLLLGNFYSSLRLQGHCRSLALVLTWLYGFFQVPSLSQSVLVEVESFIQQTVLLFWNNIDLRKTQVQVASNHEYMPKENLKNVAALKIKYRVNWILQGLIFVGFDCNMSCLILEGLIALCSVDRKLPPKVYVTFLGQ